MRRAIATKRDGGELAPAAWAAIVSGYLGGTLDDAQVAALLMACVIRGLSHAETRALTEAFIASGETLTAPDPRTVDKHSSGGVADTASLILVPLVAACGVPVAKLSGRALGHTGGTLDKLEALAGVGTELEPPRFFAIVREVGCAIGAQSARLVPADKRIYALRDRTATVPSPGLIAASIVSKKIASGAHGIVYDVKCGDGAFVQEPAAARALATTLVELTTIFGPRASALVSDMNEPLGPAIGTGLELCEARDFLRGSRRDPRLLALCERLGDAMLAAAGEAAERDSPGARRLLSHALASGRAYEVFERMLAAQGAERGALERLAPHRSQTHVVAGRGGFVTSIDTVALGELARDLVSAQGPTAGVRIAVRCGDAVTSGTKLATLFGDGDFASRLLGCFAIGDAAPAARPLLYFETETPSPAAPGDARPVSRRSTLESK